VSNENMKGKHDKSQQQARARMLRDEIAHARKKGKGEDPKKTPTPREFTNEKLREKKTP
jgi:hypothetical protein